MNKFNEIGFLTQDTKDFDVDSKFDEIRLFLEKEFSGDYQAMVDCSNDCMEKLDAGDAETEKGNHRWCEIEAKMNQIAFGGAEWLYFQNEPVIEIDWNVSLENGAK